MVTLEELTQYTDTLLQADRFRDYCPNGLQVQGKDTIRDIVTGVTASQALLEAACHRKADAVLVHHGYFWRSENPRITGIKRARLAMLLQNNISLIAYHLPLDVHPKLGNNAQLGRLLGIRMEGFLEGGEPVACVSHGHLEAVPAKEFRARIDTVLQRDCTHVEAGPERISTVGWCTGAGQGFIEQAIDAGLDAYISGEISEPTAHVAREAGIHYFAAGHHATERYGVQALGQHLMEKFDLGHEFVDIDNPA